MSCEPAPADAVHTLLSSGYQELITHSDNIDALTASAKRIICENTTALREATERCHLDVLLSAMLDHAPHPQGRQYVAVVLRAASEQGFGTVVEVAEAWMDCFFRVMSLLTREDSRPGSPKIPNSDEVHESTAQQDLRVLREKISRRERYMCAITGSLDQAYSNYLWDSGRKQDIPPYIYLCPADVVHILPFSLEVFNPGRNLQREAAFTWAVLRAWTGLDMKKLVRSKFSTPANAIFMARDQHYMFRALDFYLEPSDIPDRYKAYPIRKKARLFYGQAEADVEFHSSDADNNPIDPPDPELLRIHAAFAKVLYISGALTYFTTLQSQADDYGTLDPDGETDIGLLLGSRLTSLVR